jgi:hypothetical protein
MRPGAAVLAGLLAGVGCAGLTPEQSCQAICDEMAQCQVGVSGSSLNAGASCQADCLGKIDAFGAPCKSSAAYLADCFQTYTCDGDPVLCSDQASSFAIDCE